MWKCPKCGRTFKNENQSHYCGKALEIEVITFETEDIITTSDTVTEEA